MASRSEATHWKLPVERSITKEHSGQSVVVRVGDVITVQLPEAASTGHKWTLGELDLGRLAISDSGHHTHGQSIGAPNEAYWSFRALSAGPAHIEAKRWRPWEGDRSIIERFALDVDIMH